MEDIEETISKNKIVIFSESTCPDSKKVTDLFNSLKLVYKEVQLDKIGGNENQLREALYIKTGQKSLPNTFVKGWHLGGSRYTSKCANNGIIRKMLDGKYEGFDYDLMVIGEGSGACTAVLESARLGQKVAFCNYVMPTLENKRSGVLKRCLTLTCDPGKQIQRAGIIGTHITDAAQFGWGIDENVAFNWEKLTTSIQKHSMDINSVCAKASGDMLIMHFNAMPSFESVNMVKLTDNEGKDRVIKARVFIIASSTNAMHLDIPGLNCAITPDDIHCLPYHPGRVLVIGGSEAGLSCAGNLVTSGIDVTLLSQKHSMEGYDQQMIERLIDDLLFYDVKVYSNAELEEIDVIFEGKPGEYVVSFNTEHGETIKDDFNTIVFADGCLPNTKQLGLGSIGVDCDEGTGKIITDEQNNTTVKNIFALGSICKGGKKETIVVPRAAMLLVHRLYGSKDKTLNINAVPYLVSCSIDYAFVGLNEEEAMDKYGSGNIEVYHSEFVPLEYRFSSRFKRCYAKLVCVKSLKEQVVGLHLTGPYAGDVVQGFALAMKLGVKRSDFQQVIGIHPTTAEELTGKLNVTKSSREPFEVSEC